MDPVLNIFGQDAFSAMELSKAIDLIPIKWGRLGELNLFPEQGVPTTSVMIEYRNNQLYMLPTKPRGAPSSVGGVGRRYAKPFLIPHIPHEDTVKVGEIQDVRAFGTASLENVMDVVNRKLLTMANKHDITLEHMRAGVTQGKLLDNDGTVLINLFTEFGVTEPLVSFDWAGNSIDIINACNRVKRWMEDNLMGDTFDHVHAFCSPTFFDAMLTNATVKEAYKLFTQLQAINPLRDDTRKRFVFQDIVWEEYRASAGYEAADGTVTTAAFIPAGDCRFVPMGTQFTFQTYFAPGSFLEAANTPGLKRYAKQAPEKFGRWIDIYTESNPLPFCTKPKVLIRGNRDTAGTNI
jgi:hypothetical protein